MVLKILLLRYEIGQENKLFQEEYNLLFIADDKYVKKQSVLNLHNRGIRKMLPVESEIYFLKIKFYERKYLCFIYT